VRYGDERGIDLATWGLGMHTFFAGRARESAEIFARRLASIPPDRKAPRYLVGPMFAPLYWGSTPVAEAAARAEAMDTSGSPALEAMKLRILGGLNGLIGRFDAAREQLHQAADIQRGLGSQARVDGTLGHFLGPMETRAGNYAVAEQHLLSAFENMTARGDTGFSSTVAGYLAELYVELGRFDDAERYARIALDTSQPDDVEAKAQGYSQLARVQAARGEMVDAEANARRAVAISEQTDYLGRRGETQSDLAEVLATAGRRDEAIEAYERAIDNFQAKGATAKVERARRRLARIEAGRPT
jgi:tetratricopeptide (TPR) repeat protein